MILDSQKKEEDSEAKFSGRLEEMDAAAVPIELSGVPDIAVPEVDFHPSRATSQGRAYFRKNKCL